jgi:hypothetical protein
MSDAGGGSDTVGGLTGGVGGTALGHDKQMDKELNHPNRDKRSVGGR